ncbi:hypothetical protein ES708_16966 [subsurface metagenome]
MSSTDFKYFNEVIDSIGSHTQLLLVLENDNDFDTFLHDFNKSLISAKQMEENSSDLPYHVIRIGYDGDMLDDMLRLVVSDEAENFKPAAIDANLLYSKQAIFQQLYQSITKDKFIVFHIVENPLLYLFKISMKYNLKLKSYRTLSEKELAEIIQLPDFYQLPHIVDDIIIRYLKNLREQGTEAHRMKYRDFYRIISGLFMELSNVFLVAPTAGMNRHICVSSWRTQTLLLGFSPLTWSAGSFSVFDLSGKDIDARWSYPVQPSNDSRRKQYR